MPSLLIDEYPLIILPTLARIIGLNEAVFLQQVHYWCKNYEKAKDRKHYHRGRWWVYNTDEKWVADNFPFWSAATVKRARVNCAHLGVLLVDRFNAQPYDRTNWYTVDQDALDRLYAKWASGQNDQMDQVNPTGSSGSNGADGTDDLDPMEGGNLTPPIPETTRDDTEMSQKWRSCLALLEMQVDRGIYNTHFLGTTATRTDNTVTVYAHDADIAGLLASRWTATVTRTLAGVLGYPVEVQFVAKEAT